MKYQQINKAVNILYNSRIKMKRINNLPFDCTPKSKIEAYTIQDSLIKKYLSFGKNIQIIGKKIGCTNKDAQKQINVSEPFYGDIFSYYSSKSNCLLNSKSFFSPFVEPEFSFKLKKAYDISQAPYSPDKIYSLIDSVLPSIEIVDSRFKNWKTAGIYNLIADNAVNAYWIYGNEIKNLNAFNFSDHQVKLYINDKIIDHGNSSNVLGNPINALTWLINTLSKKNIILPKNYYISTGTCTPAIPVKVGDKICADFGKLGKVKFVYN